MTPPFNYLFNNNNSFAASTSSTMTENNLDLAVISMQAVNYSLHSMKSKKRPLNPLICFSIAKSLSLLRVA